MKTIPVEVVSHWPTPNYDNPERNTGPEIIIHLVFLAITVPIVLFRLYARAHSSRRLGYDDLFCGLGLVIAIAFTTACLISAFRYNSGVHMWDVEPRFWIHNFKVGMAGKILFVSSGACVRQSLLSFYRRLVDSAHIRNFTLALWAMTFANWTSCIVFNCIDVFLCNPVWAYWTYPSDSYGTCIDEGTVFMICGVIIAVIDMIILTMPIPLIATLQMTRRRKIGICFLLSMGLVATVAAFLRVWFAYKAFIETYDLGWWVTTLWICAAVEIYIALMCSCAPAIRTYLHESRRGKEFLGRILTSRHGSECSGEIDDEARAREINWESFSSYCLEKGARPHADRVEKERTTDTKRYTGSYDATTNSDSITDQTREQSSSLSDGEEHAMRITPDGVADRPEAQGSATGTQITVAHATKDVVPLPKGVGGPALEEQPFAKRKLSSAWAARQEANMIAARQAQESAGKTSLVVNRAATCVRRESTNEHDQADDLASEEPARRFKIARQQLSTSRSAG